MQVTPNDEPQQLRRNSSTSTLTSYWADEIEMAVVSALWHNPHWIEFAARELDFSVHFSTPQYRTLLRAIWTIYNWTCFEGGPNYASVVHLLREWNQFEECGGHQGINEIFAYAYYNKGRAEPILIDHIRLLREYAQARKTDPRKALRYYSGGRAIIRPNKLAKTEPTPYVVGEGVWGGIKFRVAGWPSRS